VGGRKGEKEGAQYNGVWQDSQNNSPQGTTQKVDQVMPVDPRIKLLGQLFLARPPQPPSPPLSPPPPPIPPLAAYGGCVCLFQNDNIHIICVRGDRTQYQVCVPHWRQTVPGFCTTNKFGKLHEIQVYQETALSVKKERFPRSTRFTDFEADWARATANCTKYMFVREQYLTPPPPLPPRAAREKGGGVNKMHSPQSTRFKDFEAD